MVAKIDVECPDVCNIMYEYKEIYKNRYNYPAHAHPNLANYYLHVAGCVRACARVCLRVCCYVSFRSFNIIKIKPDRHQ